MYSLNITPANKHIIDATTGLTELASETQDADNKKPTTNNSNAAPSKIPNFIVFLFFVSILD